MSEILQDEKVPVPAISKEFTEAARWMLSWQSARLASIEARASTVVGFASVSVFAAPALVASSARSGALPPYVRALLTLGVALVAVAVLWISVFVLRVRGATPAPDTRSVVVLWKTVAVQPDNHDLDQVSARMAQHLLDGSRDNSANPAGAPDNVLSGFKSMVDSRSKHLQNASIALALGTALIFGIDIVVVATR